MLTIVSFSISQWDSGISLPLVMAIGGIGGGNQRYYYVHVTLVDTCTAHFHVSFFSVSRYRKTMYWFSPAPVPVEWYEYFYVVILTVGFSALMNATAMPFMSLLLNGIGEKFFGKSNADEIDMEDALIDAIEDMSGFAPELDWTLDQCGLSSVGLPQLAQRLQKALSSKTTPMPVSAAALGSARTVGDIVDVLYNIKAMSKADGI